MTLIYLASPYSHPDKSVRESRYDAVVKTTAELTLAGWFVFSPIAHSHPMADRHDLPGDWSFWERIDREFIRHCDALVVLEIAGFRSSVGVQAEIAFAREIGLPVAFYDPAIMDHRHLDIAIEIAFNQRRAEAAG